MDSTMSVEDNEMLDEWLESEEPIDQGNAIKALKEVKHILESFYSTYARRYAEVSHQFLQSVYKESSHPDLKGDVYLHGRLKELTKGNGLKWADEMG